MLEEHCGYLADAVRLDRFRRAIAARVRPADRVADLGCGSGVLGLLCLEAGAGRVYAIDQTNMIEVARRSLAAAGFAERAQCFRASCEQVRLPEPVDVAIADHVGFFGFDYGIVGLFRDARRRHLRPGGVVIPARLRLETALVESARCRTLAEGEEHGPLPPAFRWLREYARNTKHAVELAPGDLLSAAASLGTLDLATEERDFFSWTVELRAGRDGEAHGIGGWFEAELCEGVTMTNSPLAADRIKRPQAFLALSEPQSVRRGDPVIVTLMARPADELLRWQVRFPAANRRFDGSTWDALPVAEADLEKSRPERVPRLGVRGQATAAVLAHCDGTLTAREIQDAFLREHPGLLPSPEEASRFVSRVLARDAE